MTYIYTIPPSIFPPIIEEEIRTEIDKLPRKKAAGPDKIPKKHIKIAHNILFPDLLTLFNSCLTIHHFPPLWKQELTVIIKKASKEDYTDPNEYQPIALLNTLGKLFEKIINNQITCRAEQTKILHPGHIGRQPGKGINDPFTILSTWIHQKGRDKRVVVEAFLDVKSAYPMVYSKILIHTLQEKQCPTYRCLIIDSFLTNRTTKLHPDKYISQEFPIPNGLPQGSALSATP
ncbi:hypothetical protein O181_008051 [Austropuccinia psidii MF-1]|uniref:Reverse transcriptase domain-containing protein n=1 Tax=Austropuccinia psidii MF-1 TaxID=1389203 RepID=A0A9Q3BP36_9BASI|nr:hypothetical protein [Austropuccinia psidii MF-1]